MEHKDYWKVLIQKYDEDIKHLKEQAGELERRKAIAEQALKIIDTEVLGSGQVLLPLPKITRTAGISVKGKGISDAILAILTFEGHLGARDIINKLIEGGYQSKSKDLKRDTYIALNRLSKKGKIDYVEEDKVRKYAVASKK